MFHHDYQTLKKNITALSVRLLFISVAFLFTYIPQSTAYAVETTNIVENEIEKQVTFILPGHRGSQGATLTKDYYIFTDWYNDNSVVGIFKCSRSGKNKNQEYTATKSCEQRRDKETMKYGHASSLHYTPGASAFQLVANANYNPPYQTWCISVKTLKHTSMNNCSNKLQNTIATKLTRSSNSGLLQGYTQYGDVYIRGWGGPNHRPNEIRIYDYDKKNVELSEVFKLPNTIEEVEDVMVDSDGSVWFTSLLTGTYKCDNKGKNCKFTKTVTKDSSEHKKLIYYKVSKKVMEFKDGTLITKNRMKENKKESNTSDPSKDSSAKQQSTNQTNNNSNNNNTAKSTNDSADTDKTDNTNKSSKSNKSSTPNKDNSKSEEKTIDTILFGSIKDDGKGCGVFKILNLVSDILTAIVGIASIIGISVTGTTYITAGGDEQRVTKAKRRLYEIVLGLFLFAISWALINWLLPGGIWNSAGC